MKCEHCHKDNRDIAKFCRWCGSPLSAHNLLDKIIGLDEVKQQMRLIVETYNYLHSRKDIANVRLSINTIIVGETGTGKTMLAEIIRDYFYQHKIIEKSKLTLVDAVDFHRFVDKWDDNIKKAKGGILFFDNVQKLLSDKYSNQVNPLDKLFVEMDHWKDDPIVVLSGLPKGLDDFLLNNPSVANRFKYKFHLPTPGYMELYKICQQTLRTRYSVEQYTPAAELKLQQFFKYHLKNKDESYGYAHEAIQVAEDIFTSFISRGANNHVIEPDDIRGFIPEEKDLSVILAEVDQMIGKSEVKRAIKEIAFAVKNNVERQERGLGNIQKSGVHIVLTGNPGTGKTTIARKLGEILSSIGYLESGHVVEVDRSQMVSMYQGETPKLVDRLCNKAKGGILFVDEAYTLAPINSTGERDQQGAQALEKLMKRMEDNRGDFVVVLAGYRIEMDNLFRVNPGFRSRFNYFLNIDDYNPDELLQIINVFASEKKYVFSIDAETLLKKVIKEMHERQDKDFANGRSMRLLFDKICKRQAERLEKADIHLMIDEQLMTIEKVDIPYDSPSSVDYRECLLKLSTLVGLESVKKEISNLAAFINLQILRGEQNTFQGKHYVFTGNPGTGKTTVARIMSDVFRTLGILSRGHLVEADRSKLVAGYSGQTAIKTNQLIDSAIGGVLFIDEAYTLKSSDNDSFGTEAIDTLLKRLEDDRGKFICIVAGYTNQMHDFINSNPGLKSRFTHTIHFDDYSADELTQIFVNLAESRHFKIDDKTKSGVHRLFEQLYLRKDKNFGNAREVRKIFDATIERQSQRLVKDISNSSNTEYDIYDIIYDDLPLTQDQNVKSIDQVLNELDEFIGMRSVKNMIRRLAVQSMFMKQRSVHGVGKTQQISMNFILTGNPGTGKTTLARKMGEILQSMEILPSSKVIEVSRATLIGKYMGETPKIVNNMCDKALGGILFIDEAYNLCADNDNYGQEALDTLMKRMEDDRGKFVVIASGYKDNMDAFMSVNPGLSSRFTHRMHIDDYNEDELLSIFKKMASKDEYVLSQGAELKLMDAICRLVVSKDSQFGNAREMRNMLDKIIQHLSYRVSKMKSSEITEDVFKVIMPEDIYN